MALHLFAAYCVKDKILTELEILIVFNSLRVLKDEIGFDHFDL